MREMVGVCSRTLTRVAVLTAVAASAAGCSSEFTRFNENLFGTTPSASRDVTGAVPGQSTPVARIDAQPLPGTAPAPVASHQPAPQRMAMEKPAPTKFRPRGGSGVHIVTSGESLISIAGHYKTSVKDIVTANRMTDVRLKTGDRLVIPNMNAEASAPKSSLAAKPAPAAAKIAPAVAVRSAPAANQKIASIEPQATARLVTPAPEASDDAGPRATGSTPTFRWPVRGRVISGFGPSSGGQANDGINLAVPEGTSVRAAEDGVVAYAGSELKGYGNLVLVRHSNGFVTAYAHASELMVKRGDQVRRGQVIAKSGQSGTVTAPQLHFEIRKGSTPVDPTQYLPNA